MVVVSQSLKTIIAQALDTLVKMRVIWIGLISVGLGLLFGYLIRTPESGELVNSIIIVLILMLVIVHRPLYGLILWLFFMVFVNDWVKIPMGAGIPDLSFSRFAVMFLAIFMLAQAAIDKFRFSRIGWAEFFILATIIGIGTAAPLSTNPKKTFQWVISLYFVPMSTYFFAKNLVKSKADLQKVLWAVALLGFVCGAYTLFEYYTGHVLFLPGEKDLSWIRLERGSGIKLIRGIMGNSGLMGRALATTIPVTFYLFLESEKTKSFYKIILSVMLLVQFYAIVLTMARSPWFALLLSLFVMQIFYPRFRKVFWAITLVAAVVIWATWDQVSDSQVSQRINDDTSTLEGREARWDAGLNMWKEKPVRGWGFGRFEQQSGKFRTDGINRNFRNGAVENDYLYILVGSGLIGLLPYLMFILVPLINSFRLYFRARAPDWRGFITPNTLTVVWAVLICLLFTSYSAKQVQPVIKLMPFALVGAIVGSQEYLLRPAKNRRQVLADDIISKKIERQI